MIFLPVFRLEGLGLASLLSRQASCRGRLRAVGLGADVATGRAWLGQQPQDTSSARVTVSQPLLLGCPACQQTPQHIELHLASLGPQSRELLPGCRGPSQASPELDLVALGGVSLTRTGLEPGGPSWGNTVT